MNAAAAPPPATAQGNFFHFEEKGKVSSMPKDFDADEFLPPPRRSANSGGGGNSLVVLLIVAIAIGVFIWHTNRQDRLAREEAEREARVEEQRIERKKECEQYISGAESFSWTHYDLSTPRDAMERAKCDDDGEVVCPIGYAQKAPCDVCAEGYSGEDCSIASCEVKLASNGGNGKCVNGRAVCNDNAYGDFCQTVCDGSFVVSPTRQGCQCPSEYKFLDRTKCSGACINDSVAGEDCDECAPGYRSTASNSKPTSKGCVINEAHRNGEVELRTAFGEWAKQKACDLAKKGCLGTKQLSTEFGASMWDGISTVRAPVGFEVITYRDSSCRNASKSVVCDPFDNCNTNSEYNALNREAHKAIRVKMMNNDTC